MNAARHVFHHCTHSNCKCLRNEGNENRAEELLKKNTRKEIFSGGAELLSLNVMYNFYCLCSNGTYNTVPTALIL